MNLAQKTVTLTKGNIALNRHVLAERGIRTDNAVYATVDKVGNGIPKLYIQGFKRKGNSNHCEMQ